MSVQGTSTGSGKTTQPPTPSYEAAMTKPFEMGAAQPSSNGNLFTQAVAPGQQAGNLVYNQGGTTIDDKGVRRFSDGSSEQLSSGTIGQLINPGATAGLIQATGNGQQIYPQGGAGGAMPTGGTGSAGGAGAGAGAGGASFGGGGFGAGQVQGPVNDTSRQRVEQAILSRLEPQFRSDESKLRNQLLSSGLEVGSPAYASELDRLQRGQNDARQQAILTGGTEESRQVGLNSGLQGQAFNQGLQGATFDNQTRQQMLSELLLQRNTPLNELNSLRTGSQVSTPQFGSYYTNSTAAAPVFDAATAQGNYNMQAAQQNQSGFNSFLGGLAGLGGAGIMKYSDIRLKANVQALGKTPGGIPLYSWDWKDGSGSDTGVIAQEVQAILPDAVMEDTSGFLMVDYSKIH